jgi:uncharacterized OB-fold protein
MVQRRPDRVLGPGHNTFWELCGKGELRLPRCVKCSHIAWPVVATCEHCGSGEFSWALMSGRGKIIARCSFERDYYAGVLPLPWDTILVELAEGPLFISNPKGLSYQDIQPGMPVKVAFIPCEDQAGSFQLPVFERA